MSRFPQELRRRRVVVFLGLRFFSVLLWILAAVPSSFAFLLPVASSPKSLSLTPTRPTPRKLPTAGKRHLSKLGLQVNAIEGTDVIKNTAIVLFLFGGLIPATISANIATVQALTGESRKSETEEYVAESGASGPELAFSSFMLSSDPILLADVIAVVGRLTAEKDSIADWKNLASAKMPNIVNTANPPQWLPRDEFKQRLRQQNSFVGWPLDARTGQPVGGQALKEAEEGRVSKRNAVLSDPALDIVFDTWAAGSSVATPDKVQDQLKLWRPSTETFQLNSFVGAALRSRAITLSAALTFVLIQVVAFFTLLIAPVLRTFLNLDIGFGQLGECVGTCSTLF